MFNALKHETYWNCILKFSYELTENTACLLRKINQLIFYTKVIAIYCENCTGHKYTLWVKGRSSEEASSTCSYHGALKDWCYNFSVTICVGNHYSLSHCWSECVISCYVYQLVHKIWWCRVRFSHVLPVGCFALCMYCGHGIKIHAITRAVSGWPVILKAQVQSQASQGEIGGGQSDTGTGLALSTSVFLCVYYFTKAPFSAFDPKDLYVN